jgi:hypothetical protein
LDSDEFAIWTETLVAEGRLTPEQGEDVRHQRMLFDEQRLLIEDEWPGRVTGFVAGQLLVANDIATLLEGAAERHGVERQVYFESIGIRLAEPEEGMGFEVGDELRMLEEKRDYVAAEQRAATAPVRRIGISTLAFLLSVIGILAALRGPLLGFIDLPLVVAGLGLFALKIAWDTRRNR